IGGSQSYQPLSHLVAVVCPRDGHKICFSSHRSMKRKEKQLVFLSISVSPPRMSPVSLMGRWALICPRFTPLARDGLKRSEPRASLAKMRGWATTAPSARAGGVGASHRERAAIQERG